MGRTRTSISHAEEERAVVLEIKVLILKLLAIDTLASGAVARGEVTTLDHERYDDSVEARALVVEGNPGLAIALLARAETSEVVGGFGDNIIVL